MKDSLVAMIKSAKSNPLMERMELRGGVKSDGSSIAVLEFGGEVRYRDFVIRTVGDDKPGFWSPDTAEEAADIFLGLITDNQSKPGN